MNYQARQGLIKSRLVHYYYKLRGAQRLRYLTIKPTYKCTANCIFCEYRKDFASDIFKKKDKVTTDRWIEIVTQAKSLGATNLVISGGEPLLYKDLPKLISHSKRLGLEVGLNTNGSLITNQEKAEVLSRAGLNHAMISLDSIDPEVHDQIRRTPGLWRRAVRAMEYLRSVGVRVVIHTIISRHQYKNLHRLVQFCLDNSVSSIVISHVEADAENNNMLMTVDQIHEFKKEYCPQIISLINNSRIIPERTKPIVIKGFKAIFPDDEEEIKNYSRGYYKVHSKQRRPCLIPYYYSQILEDGSVLPCNAVEYTHEPIVGNILVKDYTEIWNSKEFNWFRIRRMDWCNRCPMQAHRVIPLVQ